MKVFSSATLVSYLRPFVSAETPAGSIAAETKQAEGFSIPVDWSISIDDEGYATVDDRHGRMTAGDEQDAAAGQGTVLAGAKRSVGKPEDGEPVPLCTVLHAETKRLA